MLDRILARPVGHVVVGDGDGEALRLVPIGAGKGDLFGPIIHGDRGAGPGGQSEVVAGACPFEDIQGAGYDLQRGRVIVADQHIDCLRVAVQIGAVRLDIGCAVVGGVAGAAHAVADLAQVVTADLAVSGARAEDIAVLGRAVAAVRFDTCCCP